MYLKERQQAAGNSTLIGGGLSLSNLDIDRTTKKFIGVLERLLAAGWVSKKGFESEIRNYLLIEHQLIKNKTAISHFLTKPVFMGFIKCQNGRYRISNYGEGFLTKYMDEDKKGCTDIFLEQLHKVKYPNPGTVRVSPNVRTYPYRMVFYFLREEGCLTGEFLIRFFPYIINAKSLDEFGSLKSSRILPGPEDYLKFYSWDIGTLVNVGILNRKRGTKKNFYDDIITINDNFKDSVDLYYGQDKPTDLFHSEDIYNVGQIHRKKYNADAAAKDYVRKRDNYTCRLTFIVPWNGKDGNPYCEVHHIVPLEFREEILRDYHVDIDTPEYMIAVRCDIHQKIHRGHNRCREKVLRNSFDCLTDEAKNKMDLTWEKYCGYYNFKEDDQQELFDWFGSEKYLTNRI